MKFTNYNCNPALKRRRFSLIELVFAMGIFAIVTTAFYGLANRTQNLMNNLDQRAQAWAVMDNTVARIAAEKRPAISRVDSIFEHEFANSPLAQEISVSNVFEVREGTLYLEIIDLDGKELAHISIPLAETQKGKQP